jgi:segregation and condensation protein B
MSEELKEELTPELVEELTEELTERLNLTEALLFASPEPQNYKKIARFLGRLTKAEVCEVVELLNRKYTEGGHCFRIREIADGFQICLLPNMTTAVEKYFKKQRERRLTPAGLETLSIIAYKQPVTKGEVEHIRGVNIDGTLNTLLERKLVTIVGRAEKVGHPLLYGTTKKFLEYFGLKNLGELPQIEEFAESFKAKKKGPQQELGLEGKSGKQEDQADEHVKLVLKGTEEDERERLAEPEGAQEVTENNDETE